MTSETAIIEVSIPMHYLDDEGSDECGICYSQCCSKECCRYETQTTCCDQTVCSECLTKLCIRCRCTESCEQIICICPFCRDMSIVSSVSLFNARLKLCTVCLQQQKTQQQQEEANAAPVTETHDS